MENNEQIQNEELKLISDIVSPDEIEQFYTLLPKIQQAKIFLDSINSNKQPAETMDKPYPYQIELDVNCLVFKKANDASSSNEIVEHQNKKFCIDFIVKDYVEFVNTFFDTVTESLTQTCSKLYKAINDDDKKN